MASELTNYRLYFLNVAGGVTRTEDVQFETDAAAIEHSKQFVDGLALELWAGKRKVSRIESTKLHREKGPLGPPN
jgi:hypothetical protein